MYKIKLLQSIELKITVPKGAKSGEIAGKFIDNRGIISRNREYVYIYTQKGRESTFLNEIKDYISAPVTPELRFDEFR